MLSSNYISPVFLLSSTTMPSCLFSPQAFNAAAPDSPISKGLDSYFTNNTQKNMCSFLHHNYPPTWLWSLSSWHPSHTQVPVQAASCLSPLNFTMLTYSGTFVSWQFSPLFPASSVFPFQKISAISVYDYCHSFSQKIKVLSCPFAYLLEKLTGQTELPESNFSPSTLS